MKIIMIFIICVCFILSCKNDYTKTIETYSNGRPKTIHQYKNKNDLQNYKLIKYYPNGVVKFIGMVSNKRFVEFKVATYENGKVKQIEQLVSPCEFTNCCCDAKVTRYDTLGRKYEDFENRNGVENGIVNIYDSLGKLTVKYEMRNGKRDGFTFNYHENGVISAQGSYKEGIETGLLYYFDEKGDSLLYYNYEKGEKSFPYKKWLKNGNILLGNYYKNDALWIWFDKSGKEIKRVIKLKGSSGFIVPE